LDLGTSYGWAFAPVGKSIISGVWDLRPDKAAGGGLPFVKFVSRLSEIDHAQAIDLVVYEEAGNRKGVDAAHVYGAPMGALAAWCAGKGIRYQGVPMQTIKKFATGKGNAHEDDVVLAVEHWGFQPVNNEEADAIALCRLVCVNPEVSVKMSDPPNLRTGPSCPRRFMAAAQPVR
jgi:Holliday junction resolvasome RuvABC endonuclease subunit